MLNAAIWGVGKWGQTLVKAVQGKSDRIRFTAAIARTPSKYVAFAESCKLRLSDDPASVLADPSIGAVIIATANSLHPEHARVAAMAGKHVFVEKPFGLDAADAKHAVDVCERAGVTLATGFNRRFLPLMRDLQAMVAAGELGKVLHVEGHFSGPTGLRMDRTSWRGTAQEAPGGGMTARGIHILDAMIAMCGPVDWVFAISERRVLSLSMDDTTSVLLRFNNGVSAYLSTMMATADDWRFQVFGTNGWAEMRGLNRLVVCDLDGKQTIRDYERVDIEHAELEAFAMAVAGEQPYPVPSADVVHGVAVVQAIVRSAAAGESVAIDGILESRP